MQAPESPLTEFGQSSNRRRILLVLAAGFGSVLLLMVGAGIGAVRVLHQIRIQSDQLRANAQARNAWLISMHSKLLVSHAHLRDYMMDENEDHASQHMKDLRTSWTQVQQNIDTYPLPQDKAENELVKLLKGRVRECSDLIAPSADRNNRELRNAGRGFYMILSGPVSVLELTTQIEQVQSRQAGQSEALMAASFEVLRGRLVIMLILAFGTATILAIGSALYILRLERETRLRYDQVAAGRVELQNLSRRLVSAQEEERKSISRELHDQVAQTLNALLVDVGNVQKRVTNDAVSQEYLLSIQRMANDSVNSIRDIALLLRPSMLDDLGLAAALDWQAREVSRRTGLKVKLSAEGVADDLPDGVRTCVYRVVQEALLNSARHAGAKSVDIHVKQDTKSLEVSVRDDGSGFDARRVRGLGLLGMEERVREAGGVLRVDSEPAKGTTVFARIPL